MGSRGKALGLTLNGMSTDDLAARGRLAIAWAETNVLVWPTLAQIAVVAVSIILLRVLAPRLRAAVRRPAERLRFAPGRRLGEAVASSAPWLALLLVLWFAERAFGAMRDQDRVIRFAESLVFAWVLIRLSSALVRSPRLARTVAAVAWVIAALNIVGLIGPTTDLLGSMAVTVGTLRLSVLLVIKAALLLVVLIWLANLVSHLAEVRLEQAELTPSMRVLAAKIVRIGLLVLAVVVALGAVGIDLTAFAVFSGAIGVGVGFGLQKVVSNLISGVILLLDRSIKPGDVIEIDGTYGWITRLNARFASVVTRDGTEHLIPNEDLITNRVVNWSYSDELVRLRVPFGIAYDADVHQAMRLAREAAARVARVLTERPPICLMTGFGDSTVDFELRFWIDDPRNGTANVRSDVMVALWDAYHAAGIEFPFPQRDITLRNPEVLGRVWDAGRYPAPGQEAGPAGPAVNGPSGGGDGLPTGGRG